MAKIGLAAELAKQAAKAALDEVTAQEAPARKAAGGWKVPVLSRGFDLDSAVKAALGNAQIVLNRQLEPEGLVVEMQQGMPQTETVPDRALNETVASVREAAGGKTLRGYDTLGLLRLYAVQRQAAGAVVDGQV